LKQERFRPVASFSLGEGLHELVRELTISVALKYLFVGSSFGGGGGLKPRASTLLQAWKDSFIDNEG